MGIYSDPQVTISNITSHSFDINATVPTGAEYEVPIHYLVSVYCNTPGASFQTIQFQQVNSFPYTVSGLWGGEDFWMMIEAVYQFGNDTVSGVTIATTKTPIIPITSISLVSGSTNLTLRTGTNGSGRFAYNNLAIRPNVDYGDADNASVLDGTRIRATYIIEGTGKVFVANNDYSGQGNRGWMFGVDGGRGTCTIKVVPGDKINVDTASLDGIITVEQAVKDLMVVPDYMTVLLSEGTLVLDNINVLPDDANNKDVTITSDDLSICTVSGNVLTLLSTGVCNITVTSDDDPSISKILTVEVTSGSRLWHEEYDTCPEFMNTTDFNSIVDNILYLADKFSVTPTTPPQKASNNDGFLAARNKIDYALDAIVEVLTGASISGTADITNIRNSDYAPSQSEWNYILGKMREAKDQ